MTKTMCHYLVLFWFVEYLVSPAILLNLCTMLEVTCWESHLYMFILPIFRWKKNLYFNDNELIFAEVEGTTLVLPLIWLLKMQIAGYRIPVPNAKVKWQVHKALEKMLSVAQWYYQKPVLFLSFQSLPP